MLKLTTLCSLLLVLTWDYATAEDDIGDKINEAFDMSDCYCGSKFNLDNLDCLARNHKCVEGCVNIADSCYKTWMVGVVAGAVILVLILIITCCICCFCRCR